MRHRQRRVPSRSEGKWLRGEDLPLTEIGPQKKGMKKRKRRKEKEEKKKKKNNSIY